MEHTFNPTTQKAETADLCAFEDCGPQSKEFQDSQHCIGQLATVSWGRKQKPSRNGVMGSK